MRVVGPDFTNQVKISDFGISSQLDSTAGFCSTFVGTVRVTHICRVYCAVSFALPHTDVLHGPGAFAWSIILVRVFLGTACVDGSYQCVLCGSRQVCGGHMERGTHFVGTCAGQACVDCNIIAVYRLEPLPLHLDILMRRLATTSSFLLASWKCRRPKFPRLSCVKGI